jgi:hypothetical protein
VRRIVLLLAALPVLAAGLVLVSAALDQPNRYYRDTVVVNAPRPVIWSLLTDFGRYDEWNPYLTRGSGRASEGATVKLRVEPPGEQADDVSAEVLIVHPRRKIEWQTRMLGPGVLDHEQIFRVLPLGPNRFRIVQEARFEGVLVPFVDFEGEHRGLVRMLRALATRAERSYQSSSG